MWMKPGISVIMAKLWFSTNTERAKRQGLESPRNEKVHWTLVGLFRIT